MLYLFLSKIKDYLTQFHIGHTQQKFYLPKTSLLSVVQVYNYILLLLPLRKSLFYCISLELQIEYYYLIYKRIKYAIEIFSIET